MRIISLSLKNFRNYGKTEFVFKKDATLIIGPNTSGKTNILEAIFMLAIGRSNRAVRELDLIKLNQSNAQIEANIKLGDLETKLFCLVSSDESDARAKKHYKVNGVLKTQAGFLGNFYCVYFSPADIRLVLGSPLRRRSALDSFLCQSSRFYKRALLDYSKVVRNKNKLLEKIKLGLENPSSLNFWNERLLENARVIQTDRENFFNFANNKLVTLGPLLNSKNEKLSFIYKKSTVSKEKLVSFLENEIKRGVSLCGPHRDDFEFIKDNSKNLANYGSRGEQRTAVFALKVCELLYLQDRTNEKPVLLLDDIFSELDKIHRKNVLDVIKGYQAIITTAEKDLIPRELIEKSDIITLH